MSRTERLTKAGLWVGPILLIVICSLPLVISGRIDFGFFSSEPEPDRTGWPRELSERSYYDTLADIVLWEDFCDTALIDELVAYNGGDPASEPGEPEESMDSSELSEDRADIRFGCGVWSPSRDCGGPPEQLDGRDGVRVYFSPKISEAAASRAHEISVNDIPIRPDGDVNETQVGGPWRDGMITDYFQDGRLTMEADVVGDFYTVSVHIDRADPTCAPDSAELVDSIAEDYLPRLHASIEERIARGE